MIQHQVGKHPSRAPGNFDEGLEDARVLKLQRQLVPRYALPEDTEFLTFVQPMGEGMRNGVWRANLRAMVFMVVSPNPNPRYKEKYIKTRVATDLDNWMKMARERAISDIDPAFRVFEELCRKHEQSYREWSELQ